MSDWQAEFERGVHLMEAQQFGAARESLEKLLAAEPSQPLIAYSLAVACAQDNNPARAVELLRGLEQTGNLTPAGRQLLDDLTRKNPEPAGAPAAPQGGLQLNFGNPTPAAQPAPGLQLNFGNPAPAAQPAPGLQLNFGAQPAPANTPKVNFTGAAEAARPAFSNRFGPVTLMRVAGSAANWKGLFEFCDGLKNEGVKERVKIYRECHEEFGDCWYYADVLTLSYAAARCVKPQNYLDLGTGRGDNLFAVVRAQPEVNFVVCENWDDAGLNEVHQMALSLKAPGKGKFMQGACISMLPKLRQANPDLRFDLITIDNVPGGDLEALLRLALPMLNIGGAAILSDLNRDLRRGNAWRNALGMLGGFVAVEYCEAGAGVAVAVKVQ